MEFKQVCVWPATVVGADQVESFESFMLEHFGAHIKYIKEFKTLPGDGGEGGRNDVLFYVASEDIGHFAVPRLQAGIRWLEDVLDNETRRRQETGEPSIYPAELNEMRCW